MVVYVVIPPPPVTTKLAGFLTIWNLFLKTSSPWFCVCPKLNGYFSIFLLVVSIWAIWFLNSSRSFAIYSLNPLNSFSKALWRLTLIRLSITLLISSINFSDCELDEIAICYCFDIFLINCMRENLHYLVSVLVYIRTLLNYRAVRWLI